MKRTPKILTGSTTGGRELTAAHRLRTAAVNSVRIGHSGWTRMKFVGRCPTPHSPYYCKIVEDQIVEQKRTASVAAAHSGISVGIGRMRIVGRCPTPRTPHCPHNCKIVVGEQTVEQKPTAVACPEISVGFGRMKILGRCATPRTPHNCKIVGGQEQGQERTAAAGIDCWTEPERTQKTIRKQQ